MERRINALHLAYKLLDEIETDDMCDPEVRVMISKNRVQELVRKCEEQYPNE